MDLATGSVNIAFPLRAKPGKLPFASKIIGTSQVTEDSNSQWNPMLWSYQDPTTAIFGYQVAAAGQVTCHSGNHVYYYEFLDFFTITDSTGAVHTLSGLTPKYGVGTAPSGQSCASSTGTTGLLQATDNSGYSMIISNGILTVYDRQGHYWTGSCTYAAGCFVNSSMSDPDGTTIVDSYAGLVTDSLGTTVLTGVPSYVQLQSLSNLSTTAFSYTDANNATQQYSFGYTTLNLASNFNCINSAGVQNPQDYGPNNLLGPISISMLTSISLPGPNAGKYLISYEPTNGMSGYYTGRVASITLPSGGSISYSYSGGNHGINCTIGSVPILTVTVNDNNGNNGTFTYVSSLSTTPASETSPVEGVFTVTKTDPLNNQTVYTFDGEYQTQAQYYQGSATGTPLKTVSTCYNGQLSNCTNPTAVVHTPITQVDVFTSFGTSSPSLDETLYDTYGNPTSQKEMDYGNIGSSGQCTSATTGVCVLTTTTYGSWNGSSCTAVSTMPSLPCDIKTANNNTGAVLAETRVTYSATGHPTAVSKWVSGSTWLTTNNQYNSTGTLAQTQDPVGNITQYGYAATGSGGCNSVMLTSTTYPLSSVGSSSQTWNCNGGVLASSTDVNTQPTTYSYNDPQWRATGVSYPDGGSTSTTYNTGSSLPWTISTSTLIAGSTTLARLTQYDGLVRVVENELTSDPNGTVYVDTIYDVAGNVHSTSNPHRSGTSPSDGATTYYYDALSRPIQTVEQDTTSKQQWCYNGIVSMPAVANCRSHVGTANNGTWVDYSDEVGNHWQRTSDSMGRLTQVIEPNGTTQAPTMETDYAYDGLSNLLSTSQCGGSCPSSAAVARTFQYDGLSRLLQAVNPEVGTTSYTYDSDSNLTTKTSPAVNVASGNQTSGYRITTNFSYDSLNRLVAKSYLNDPNGTPWTCFLYDMNGSSTPANAKGRLAAEWTQVGQCPANTTVLPRAFSLIV